MTKALSTKEFKKAALNKDTIVVDTREKLIFSQAFIPGSVFIGLENEKFAEWAKMVITPHTNILIVADIGKESVALQQLTDAGFVVSGFLNGGFDEWKNDGEPVDMVIDIEADEFAMDIPFDEKMVILDVRTEDEYNKAHVAEAVNIPLDQLVDSAISSNLEEEDNHYVYCGGGYRSLIAASLLKKEGLHNVRNILGGFSTIKKEEKIPIEKAASKE